jgi:hypothetical protein
MPLSFFKNLSVGKISPILRISVLIYICFSLVTFIATAQSPLKVPVSNKTIGSDSSRFELGIAAGASFNDFTKGQPHTSSNNGFTGGFSINYKLYKNFSIQLEVNYLQQGGRMLLFKDDTRIGLPENLDNKNVTNSSFKLNTLDVPVLLNYSFKTKQTWKPSIYLGGSYGNTFNTTESYQKTGDLLPGEDIIATVSGTRNVTSEFNSSRINFIAGANLKLPLTSRLLLLIDMRYLNGLTPAREHYSYMDKIGFGSNIRTNSFLTRIGVILPLHSKKTK